VTKSQNLIDRLSGRVALVAMAAAVLLVVLVGWFALVAPKSSKAADLQARTENVRLQLIDTQRFLHSSAGRESARQLERLTRAVPAEPRMSAILRQLTQASRSAGVRITGVTPAAFVSTTGGQAIPLTVTAEGHYFRLKKFIHLVRAAALVGTDSIRVSGRLLAIDSLEFSNSGTGSSGSGTSGLITATLAVDAFVSASPQGVATNQTGTGVGSASSATGTTSTASP
jgi:Tfp pilus assembly protein PilO